MRNGRITSYSLTCFITVTGMGQISDVFEAQQPEERYKLSEFRPGTEYTCLVVAINSAGSGPSNNYTVKTPEDGKHIAG